MDRQVDLQRRLGELGLVHVDHHLERGSGERIPVEADLADVEPAAQHQQDVGVLHREIARPVPNRARLAHEQRIVVGHQVVGVESGGHGQAEPLRDLQETLGLTGDAHAGSGHHHRALRGREAGEQGIHRRLQRRAFEHPRLVRQAGRRVSGRIEADLGLGIDAHALDVDRHIDPGGPRAPSDGEVISLLDFVADAGGILHGDGALRDPRHHAHDIDLLVAELAQAYFREVPGDGLAPHLAGNHHHGNAVGVSAEYAVEGVDPARARGDVQDRRAPAHARIALRRHGAGLLVVHGDIGEALRPAERVVEMHRSAARHQEDVGEAFLDQQVSDIIGDAHSSPR